MLVIAQCPGTVRVIIVPYFEDCKRLELYNCCFSNELLHRELARTREDPLLGYLLWSGPYSAPRRGVLAFRLDDAAFARCVRHLEAMTALRYCLQDRYRGDVLGLLSLLLGELGRAAAPVAATGDTTQGRPHPAARGRCGCLSPTSPARGRRPRSPRNCT